MLNIRDYKSFFNNDLYQGPKKRYWDSKMSSIFKSQLNKHLIIDDKITKKSLKQFLLILDELQLENKYLIISPQKHRGPRKYKLSKQRLKYKNWLDNLDKYYVPLAFRTNDFSLLRHVNEISRRRKEFADEYVRKGPSSPLKPTLSESKSLFVEKKWVSGCITNRVSLKRNHLNFKHTPLRSFFPQIKKNESLLRYLKSKKKIQILNFNNTFEHTIDLIKLPDILILLSNDENGPLLKGTHALNIPIFSTHNGVKKRHFRCDYPIYSNVEGKSLLFLENIINNFFLKNDKNIKNNYKKKNILLNSLDIFFSNSFNSIDNKTKKSLYFIFNYYGLTNSLFLSKYKKSIKNV